MVWHSDVISSAAVAALTTADGGMRAVWPAAGRDSGTGGRAIRSVELLAFDLPVSAYFVALNHELGHTFRASEKQVRTHLAWVPNPWSSQPFGLWADDYPNVGGSLRFDLAIESGGLEASRLLKDRLDEEVLRSRRVSFGQASVLLTAALDAPLYAATNLGPNVIRDIADGPQGDIASYIYQVMDQRARAGQPVADLVHSVKRRTFLNLIDLTLVNDVLAVGRWIVRGDRSIPIWSLKLAGVTLLPSFRYSLTPIGPEFSVRSQLRRGDTGGVIYVRWSERVGDVQQKGVGGRCLLPALHGVEPTIRFDAWSHSVDGIGVRGELGVTTPRWPSPRLSLTTSVGVKSAGYLDGFPLDGSAYVVAGLSLAIR